MANILNIDTSSKICSVALATDGEIRIGYESHDAMDHSVNLAPFIKKCLEWLKQQNLRLDAVSVSSGPGSYTGLRIGLSMAKGLTFGYDIPLILISSLEILAVRAIFSYPDFAGDEIIVPMIDARRMEVYCSAFDSSLQEKMPSQAMILDENSFSSLSSYPKVIFIGDGTEKFKSLYKYKNGLWLGPEIPHAKYMVTLSEKYYRESRFSDVAYSVPSYLKEYQTTKSKK